MATLVFLTEEEGDGQRLHMLTYYSCIILISLTTLLVLCILIAENDRISEEYKKLFYLAYGLIGVSAFAEFLGIVMIGRNVPHWILKLVKCADYILTPMAGGSLALQMYRDERWNRALQAVLVFNLAFQIVSCFTGWMVTIDSGNRYMHGPMYFVYMAVYLMVMGLVVIRFIQYGNSFRRKNRTSLYAIMLFILAGTIM